MSAPLRPKNLAELHEELNFINPGGPENEAAIRVYRQRVKKVTLTYGLDPDQTARLRLYQAKVRNPTWPAYGGYLFPGERGPKNPGWLSSQTAELTDDELGVRLTAHVFRHLAGLFWLLGQPGDYETVRQLLGHRKLRQ